MLDINFSEFLDFGDFFKWLIFEMKLVLPEIANGILLNLTNITRYLYSGFSLIVLSGVSAPYLDKGM
jgi:hypothetical protein